MRILILLAAISFLLTVCNPFDPKKPISDDSLSLDHNSIQMKIGDSWLYRQTFISIGKNILNPLPDTLISYAYFEGIKDTIIDSLSYLIIEGRDYDIGRDSNQIKNSRYAIHFSDFEVLMYEFKPSANSSYSVLKTVANNFILTRKNYGTRTLKNMSLAKLSNVMNFDTSVFWDFITPISYPLVKDSIYIYRDTAIVPLHVYVRKKFHGIETVQVPFGILQAYKFEWLTKEYYPDSGAVCIDWVGRTGLVKRYLHLNVATSYDTAGVFLDSIQTDQVYELIGKHDINPDTLIPWGKR